MNSIEKSLDKIAQNILNLDEASLALLWDQYKNKAEQCYYIFHNQCR
jgi:hypothetical protein